MIQLTRLIRQGLLNPAKVLAAIGLWCQAAHSQWATGIEHPFHSGVPTNVVELARDVLLLEPPQLAQAEELVRAFRLDFEAFAAQHEADWKRLSQDLDAAPPASDVQHELYRTRDVRFRRVADEQSRMDGAFFVDLRGVLTESQQERWDAFLLRCHGPRWSRSMPKYFSEERVNVEELLRSEIDGLRSAGVLSDELERSIDELVKGHVRAQVSILTELEKQTVRSARERFRRMDERVSIEDGVVYVGPPSPRAAEIDAREGGRLADQHRRLRDEKRRVLSGAAALLPTHSAAKLEWTYWLRAAANHADIASVAAVENRFAALLAEDIEAEQRDAVLGAYFDWQSKTVKLLRQLAEASDSLWMARFPGIDQPDRIDGLTVLKGELAERVDHLPAEFEERIVAILGPAARKE